ncbi:MAG: YraN family protein [Bacillota bacterium]
MNAREYGRLAEAAAAEFLARRGYQLVKTNYRCRAGEVDLIAWDGPVLVFVEVKARRRSQAGAPVEAIDGRKLRRLRAAAGHYLATHFRQGEPPCRFDAVLVSPGVGGVPSPGVLSLIRGIA